ncbi:MAG TPA: hypothetical protein VK544_10370 [Gemmatimonadaceae bacterium]|nr:hypothetical protein [Gemmatimonadaceae bacterium]
MAALGCSDTLSVPNGNNPDAGRALARPSDVEALIGSSLNTAWRAMNGQNDNVDNQMRVFSFENSSSLANFGFGARIGLPRNPIDNSKGNPVLVGNFWDYAQDAKGARSAALGLAQLIKPGFTLGTPAQDIRGRAFAFFVMGMGNANMALVYDSGAVVNEFNGTDIPFPPLLGHDSLMKLALIQLDSAQANAALMTTPLLATWIPGNALTGPQFLQVIRSYKARFRASVARTPTERAAVDWTKVRDDALGGITADLVIDLDPSKSWDYVWYVQHFLFDAWTQQSPLYAGMADSVRPAGDPSGPGYDAWLALGINSRDRFLIKSADQRFPPGETRAAQQTASTVGSLQTPSRPNLYFRNRTSPDVSGLPYTVSQYDWFRMQQLYQGNRIGKFPMLQKTEVNLLAAEAYYRLGDLANAAAKINITRQANGILPALPLTMTATDQVPGGGACVPRVPDPATNFTSAKCGTLFEALKWEKRMELAFMQYGAWYFDSRGWGDLAAGTPLEWPVPYQEMDTRSLKLYNSNTAAAVGTYGY